MRQLRSFTANAQHHLGGAATDIGNQKVFAFVPARSATKRKSRLAFAFYNGKLYAQIVQLPHQSVGILRIARSAGSNSHDGDFGLLFGAIAIYNFDVFANLCNHTLNGIFLKDARFIDANTKVGYNTTTLKS